MYRDSERGRENSRRPCRILERTYDNRPPSTPEEAGIRPSDSGTRRPSVPTRTRREPATHRGKERIRRTLERHIDFDAVPDLCDREAPELVVGTVNINAGIFETFTNEEVTPDAVLASAAVPTLFEAVEIHRHYHWDGLFSQNPPIDDLMTGDAARKPDELWVIQINPQERDGEPTSLEEIADRRNELAGNISLNQELRVIERVNEWIDAGHLPKSDFSKTKIRRIAMGRAYHCSTKVDRSQSFLQELMDLGEQRAAEFQVEV